MNAFWHFALHCCSPPVLTLLNKNEMEIGLDVNNLC